MRYSSFSVFAVLITTAFGAAMPGSGSTLATTYDSIEEDAPNVAPPRVENSITSNSGSNTGGRLPPMPNSIEYTLKFARVPTSEEVKAMQSAFRAAHTGVDMSVKPPKARTLDIGAGWEYPKSNPGIIYMSLSKDEEPEAIKTVEEWFSTITRGKSGSWPEVTLTRGVSDAINLSPNNSKY